MTQPIDAPIVFTLDEMEVHLDVGQVKKAFLANIPPWVKDSREPTPNPMFDVVREGLKATLRPFMGKLLLWAYGENAPKLERREDILPHVANFIADLLLHYGTVFSPFVFVTEASDNEQNGKRVYKVLAIIANSPNRDNEDARADRELRA